jgi:hypothetical protein
MFNRKAMRGTNSGELARERPWLFHLNHSTKAFLHGGLAMHAAYSGGSVRPDGPAVLNRMIDNDARVAMTFPTRPFYEYGDSSIDFACLVQGLYAKGLDRIRCFGYHQPCQKPHWSILIV